MGDFLKMGVVEQTPLLSEDGIRPGSEPATKGLSFFSLIALCYCMVCAGAYGIEDLVGSLPPLVSLLGVVILPWFWSFPVAMMTAEMATALPNERSGFLGWIRLGLGESMSLVSTYMSIIVVMFDQSLYPIIFVSMLSPFVELSDWEHWFIAVAFACTCLVINLLGAKSVGFSSQFFSIASALPFLIMFVGSVAFSRNFNAERLISTQMIADVTGEGVKNEIEIIKGWDFGLWWSVFVWATCGFEYLGFLVHKARNPAKNFPLAIGISVLLMLLTYILPLSVVIACVPDGYLVKEGAFPVVAERFLGLGSWLTWVVSIGGCFSALGTYNAYLAASSSSVASQADGIILPRFLGLQLPRKSLPCGVSIFDTPIAGLIFYTVTTCIIVQFDFEFIVKIEAALYCIHICILNTNFVFMRYAKRRGCSTLPRPFRVTLFGSRGNWPAIIVAALPTTVAFATLLTVGWVVQSIALAFVVLCLAAYFLSKFVKRWRT